MLSAMEKRDAEALGFRGVALNGNDPVAFYNGMKEIIESVRNGNGPVFVEAHTLRLGPHAGVGWSHLLKGDALTEGKEHWPVPATRKLLRSVVMKGLAALVIEAMRAAEAAGLAEETWDNVVAQLAAADDALVRRLVQGTGPHAERRRHEMEAATALLTELGVDPTMTRATAAHLRAIVDGVVTPPDLPADGPTVG